MTRAMHRARLFFSALTVFSALLASAAGLLVFGPILEARFWPVIDDDDKPPTWRDSEGYTLVDLWVEKRRQCTHVSQRFLLGTAGEGYRSVEFTRPGLKPGGARPLGRQTFGLYRFDTRLAQPGAQIVGTIYYRCHAIWNSTSTYGPWPVPPEMREDAAP